MDVGICMHAWLSVLEPCMQAAAAIAERRARDADNAAVVAQGEQIPRNSEPAMHGSARVH